MVSRVQPGFHQEPSQGVRRSPRNLPKPSAQPEAKSSNFRQVFQTSDEMKAQFADFLNTIFYQLDEKKVFKLMEEILEDPTKTDDQIYTELLSRIQETKKTFSFFSKLWSLFVLKRGMGKQVGELTKHFKKERFNDYLEIYDRRYIKSIRLHAGMPLRGRVVAVCDRPNDITLADKIQARAFLLPYPYTDEFCLNDAMCMDPALTPAYTYKKLSKNVPKVDMIACLGGLHHAPEARMGKFVDSMASKLRPGGVLLLREHDAQTEEMKALVSMVHTFVNAADGVELAKEKSEIRDLRSNEEWTAFMAKHGFTRISAKGLILDQDPTKNEMLAFVKTPENLEELQETISSRTDYARPRNGTASTWIEWGNVRFSKQYANYIQDHHSYAFDHIGHLRQHWKHFYHFAKETIQDKQLGFMGLLNSTDLSMNFFILFMTTLQCSLNAATSLPSQLFARVRYGKEWREVANLTALEKFEASFEKL